MNFYSLNECMKKACEESQKLAHKELLEETIDTKEFSSTANSIKKLSLKLKEKSNKYMPLMKYVSRNPSMFKLLEELVEETSLLNSAAGKQIFKNK